MRHGSRRSRIGARHGALVAMGKADDAKRVLDDALTKARSQDKRGHEAAILIVLATVAEKTGDTSQAIAYLENAGQFATSVQFYRIEADAMFELARLYRDGGDLATAEARATQGLQASQRVGDRYYLPRNLSILADLKARRGHVAEAKALYEQAEDVIEGMLISVDEPYWNSSVVAAMGNCNDGTLPASTCGKLLKVSFHSPLCSKEHVDLIPSVSDT